MLELLLVGGADAGPAATDADVLAIGAVMIGSGTVTATGGVASERCFPTAAPQNQTATTSTITSVEPPATASATAARDIGGRCFQG